MAAILIENGTLIDGTGAEPRPLGALLVDGDAIVALGSEAAEAATLRKDVVRIDADGCTVMPGLIDAHCHVTFAEPQSNDELFFHRREGLAAIVATHNVRKLLLAGVTGFLDADVLFNLGVDLRDSIEAGVVPGPRMATGGNALLTAVGGTAGLLIPDQGRRGYAAVVRVLCRQRVVMMLLFAGALTITWMVFQRVPSAFVPSEDEGYFITIIQAPPGASVSRAAAAAAACGSRPRCP